MRRLILALVLAGVLTAAALAIPALAATRSVRIGDNYFVRSHGVPTVIVRRGTVVRWAWKGRSIHNVTVVRGPVKFRSPTKRHGVFSVRVSRLGTYKIICTIHGASDQSMVLKVRR